MNHFSGRQLKKLTRENRKPSGRKPGGQPGRKGITSKPKPTEFKKHPMDRCSQCNSVNIRKTKTEKRPITDVQIPPPVTTEHTIYHYDCDKCGAKDMTADTGLPSRGAFGPNIVSMAVINYLYRMPTAKNAEALAMLGINISTGTISSILNMVGSNLEAPAQEITEKIRASSVVHADETSFSLAGKKIWWWVFGDPKSGATRFELRPSRRACVPMEVLGRTGTDTWCVTDGAHTRATRYSGAGRICCAACAIWP